MMYKIINIFVLVHQYIFFMLSIIINDYPSQSNFVCNDPVCVRYNTKSGLVCYIIECLVREGYVLNPHTLIKETIY